MLELDTRQSSSLEWDRDTGETPIVVADNPDAGLVVLPRPRRRGGRCAPPSVQGPAGMVAVVNRDQARDMETPLIYMQSDIPQGITIRQWRRERTRKQVRRGLIRTLVRAAFPESRT